MRATAEPITVAVARRHPLLGWRHWLWDLARFVGLRDRLRCPSCRVVGTWKPHGGRFDSPTTRQVKRWLCKWCGHYVGPEGTFRAHVGPVAWSLDEGDKTPRMAVRSVFGRDVNPWGG